MAASKIKMSKVQVTITDIKGPRPCWQGHKVGDTWVLGRTMPAHFCMTAFNSIWAGVLFLRHGGEFPWAAEKDVVHASCPDPEVRVQYEIRRLPEE